MLQKFKQFVSITRLISRELEIRSASPLAGPLTSFVKLLEGSRSSNHEKHFHVCVPRLKNYSSIRKRRDIQMSLKLSKILVGEHSEPDLEQNQARESLFPTYDLLDREFNGIQFRNIPIVNIKATKNNTILSLSDMGSIKVKGSCGMEGFKNTKKSTNIAAQAAGTSFAYRASKRGYKTVRVIIRGLGQGRLSALKGLEIGGLDVISLTDQTKDSTRLRPKKQRRI